MGASRCVPVRPAMFTFQKCRGILIPISLSGSIAGQRSERYGNGDSLSSQGSAQANL
jgi:hypothetical protein